MLRKTFTSQPFTYRVASTMHTGLGPYSAYNPYLTTPPRIYGEEWDGRDVIAMFVNDDTQVMDAIYLFIQQNQVDWPSYLYRLHRWDASTGEYLGGVDSAYSVTQRLMSQSRDGTLYSMDNFGAVLKFAIDPTTHDLTTDGVTQFSFTSSTYSGFVLPQAYLIDNDIGLLIACGNLNNAVEVYDLVTGTLKARIPTPGVPAVVMAEDASRCYVMTQSGVIALIDYVKAQVISAFEVGTTPSGFNPARGICWDRRYRRFLNWVYTPVDTTGQNTSVIGGYFPTPLPTYLTTPIPLKPPRKFQTVPILTRSCGSVAESVAGTRVSLSLPPGSFSASVNGFPANTDGDGEALGSMTCLDAGSVVVNAAATV